MNIETSFYISLISLIITTYILILLIKIKHKFSIHFTFIGTIISTLIWTIAVIIQYLFFQDTLMPFIAILFLGISFVPPFFMLTGYFFAHSQESYKKKHLLLFIIPLISVLLATTNRFHNLFVIHMTFTDISGVYGPLFYVHTLYSYVCLVIGIYYLFSFSFKTFGIFSKQATFIAIGTAFPVILSILITFNMIDANLFYSPISFSFTMLYYWLAIIKYEFLNVIPFALQTLVNEISDGYIVISQDLLVIDFNKTFHSMFTDVLSLRKKSNILDFLSQLNFEHHELECYINHAITKKGTISFEKKFMLENFDKYFTLDITPIYVQQRHVGTVIIFKDITLHKVYTQNLEEKNIMLQNQNNMISELNAQLRELADTDGLTGTFNRRFFNNYFNTELEKALGKIKYNVDLDKQTNFAVAILDIDDFKKVNDTYGHLVGDMVLKQVAFLIKESIFSRDMLCRYGGEEFAIIFTETSRQGALTAVSKIRKSIESYTFLFNEKVSGHITISIGYASLDQDFKEYSDNILKIADERLYKAKALGKNTIVYE